MARGRLHFGVGSVAGQQWARQAKVLHGGGGGHGQPRSEPSWRRGVSLEHGHPAIGRAPETPPEMPMLRLWTSHSGRPPPQQEVSAQAPQRPRPCRWPGGSFALQRHHLAKATTGEQEPERQSAKEPVHSPGPVRRRRTPRPGGCQKPRGERSHAQRALLYLCVCDHV